VQDFGMDDTTSMLFRFASGATGYLGTVIATAETWRMQVFAPGAGRKWVTSSICRPGKMKICFINEKNIAQKQKPQAMTFAPVSTERAELEHFAQAVKQGRRLALPGGDEVHNVAVLEAIVRSRATASQPASPD